MKWTSWLPFLAAGLMAARFSRAEESTTPEPDQEPWIRQFQTLFQEKRFYQLNAIKQLLHLEPDKQKLMLDAMVEKIGKVLNERKKVIMSSGIEFHNPEELLKERDNKVLKESLALVLENTCFTSDILLRFPHYMHAKLSGNVELESHYKWALGFVHQAIPQLLDSSATRLISLALQEIGLVQRSPDYTNPYRKEEPEVKKILFDDPPEGSKKKPKKRKKGPRLTRTEL